MSKIKNQFINKKLQEVLNKEGLSKQIKLNISNDDEALIIIFASLQDQVQYYQQQMRHTNLLNSELKVIELQLRAQLKAMEIKMDEKIQVQSHTSLSQDHMKQMGQLMQKCMELQSKIVIQRELKQKLQAKVLEQQLQISMNQEQIQSSKINSDFYTKQISILKQQKVDLIQNHQKDIQKYQKDFIQQLNQKMSVFSIIQNQKFELQMRPLRNQNNQMHKQLNRLHTYLNRMLSLNNPADNWVDQVQKKYLEYERGVKALIQRQIKMETNQSDSFLQNQKDKLKARKYLLNKFLNK